MEQNTRLVCEAVLHDHNLTSDQKLYAIMDIVRQTDQEFDAILTGRDTYLYYAYLKWKDEHHKELQTVEVVDYITKGVQRNGSKD